jgi:hypothetical protein
MPSYNVDAYGYKIYANFGEDISAATAFTMELQPQNGDILEKTPTLGSGDVTVGDVTYSDGEYVEFTVTNGMFPDQSVGLWEIKATALVGTEMKVAEFSRFRITP